MSEKTNPPGGDLSGIDPTHSPAVRDLIIKIGANRYLRREQQEAFRRANEELDALVVLPEVVANPDTRVAGQALATAREDRRAAPFKEFTAALDAVAKQHPPGDSSQARLFALSEHATRLMRSARDARLQEVAILERLAILAREIEAQHALEQRQGGGIH